MRLFMKKPTSNADCPCKEIGIAPIPVPLTHYVFRSWSGSLAEQLCYRLHAFDVLRDDADHDDNRNAEQQPPESTQPTPKKKTDKNCGGIHFCDASRHPGGGGGAGGRGGGRK